MVEPIKEYRRHRNKDYTSATPLVRLVDAARPESDVARHFGGAVEDFLGDPSRKARRDDIRSWLESWRDHREQLVPIIERSPALTEIEPLSVSLAALGAMGLAALAEIDKTGARPEPDAGWSDALDRASRPVAEVELRIVDGVRNLVEAARVAP